MRWSLFLSMKDAGSAMKVQQGIMSSPLQEDFISWLSKRKYSPKARKKYFDVANKILTRVARKSTLHSK